MAQWEFNGGETIKLQFSEKTPNFIHKSVNLKQTSLQHSQHVCKESDDSQHPKLTHSSGAPK